MRKATLFIVLALALASVPSAVATWYGMGTYEPDTAFDTPDLVWADADIDSDPAVKKVYFNAYGTYYPTGTNPNTGATGSRYQPIGTLSFQVFLGIWKDCNDDGYIGLAETAVSSYRSELLLTSTICPVGSPHNSGAWVHEFIHLGPENDPTSEAVAPNVLFAEGSFVWGDIGVPGYQAGSSCPIAPLPHGTTSGTGAAIRWADCLADRAITSNVNMLDPDGSLGIRFDDPNNPQQSDSLLNQHLPVNLWGNPTTGQNGLLESGTGNPTFTAWDCNASPDQSIDDPTYGAGNNPLDDSDEDGALHRAGVKDPTDTPELDEFENSAGYLLVSANISSSDGNLARVYPVAPAMGSPTGSLIDAANHTETGLLDSCDSSGGSFSELGSTSSYADGNFEGTAQAPGKNAADMDFQFWDGTRPPAQARDAFGQDTPFSYGVEPVFSTLYNPNWYTNSLWVTDPQLVNPTSGAPSGAAYWTFYAYVPADFAAAEGLSLTPGGAVHKYGEDSCTDGVGTGQANKNGWVCDDSKWYLDPSGEDISAPESVRVGHDFQFRDVDCYDSTVQRGSDLEASLVRQTDGGPCKDA